MRQSPNRPDHLNWAKLLWILAVARFPACEFLYGFDDQVHDAVIDEIAFRIPDAEASAMVVADFPLEHATGLQIDDTGYYVTFVRSPEATDHDQLCYTYSSDGTSWSEPVVIYEGGDMFSILDSPIIHYDWAGTSTLGTVWWEGDRIGPAFSIDDGATWSDPVLVSELWSMNKQSDLAIRDDTDNWHFVYSAQNPDTGLWQIQYRRGHMEWQ